MVHIEKKTLKNNLRKKSVFGKSDFCIPLIFPGAFFSPLFLVNTLWKIPTCLLCTKSHKIGNFCVCSGRTFLLGGWRGSPLGTVRMSRRIKVTWPQGDFFFFFFFTFLCTKIFFCCFFTFSSAFSFFFGLPPPPPSLSNFLGGSVVKNLPANAGDVGSIPGSERSPGGGNDNPLQYPCLENSLERGAWWDTVHGISKSQVQLSN